jgi:hypothetical protein
MHAQVNCNAYEPGISTASRFRPCGFNLTALPMASYSNFRSTSERGNVLG